VRRYVVLVDSNQSPNGSALKCRRLGIGLVSNAARLFEWWRGHWGIENKEHWVRDETLGEDRSRVTNKTNEPPWEDRETSCQRQPDLIY